MGMKKATLISTVKRRPLPTVYFRAGNSDAFRSLGSEPDDVISTGKDEAVATKVITVDNASLVESINMIQAGHTKAPSCGFLDLFTFTGDDHILDNEK
ncbi:hypothetical protein PoB_001413700 [Plakobranchus ocellatus]|uniref:Uncharacterized protein n=1 Tax=Plakobranchus ocellatus TaxID=259542 RepID=A0AAV3YXD0_9GAST|nr:hypothetical protein PoB_001413700 [Plakobranchus ocellatus]